MKYFYRDKEYSIVPCTKEDIPSHIERVSLYWKQGGIEVTDRVPVLEEAVGLKILDSEGNDIGCIYYREERKESVFVELFYVKYTFCIAMIADYIMYYEGYIKVYFYPAILNPISYERVVTLGSIKRHLNDESIPLEVNVYNANIANLLNRYRKNGLRRE